MSKRLHIQAFANRLTGVKRSRVVPVAVALLTLAVPACSRSNNDAAAPATTSTTTTSTTALPVGPPPAVKVTPIATLDKPTAMAQRDDDNRLYVAEKTGRLRAIENGVVSPTPILDLSAEVSTGSEQGLLGVVFAPHKSTFYVDYTDKAGDTQIVEYQLGVDGTVDLHSRRLILSVHQPYPNHNGGQLAFGPDGYMYIGMGDGGSAGDPQKNGQNLTVLLGKLLRINPATPANGLPYSIPFDNPFVKQTGARGEIWAYGLRNPWRFSFDTKDQSLWIADVGQGNYEEVDHVAKDPKGGQNYGWSLREGLHQQDGGKPTTAVDPVYEYNHDGGACSVTGGYAYHGDAIPGLTGRYVFGDFCTGKISSLTLRGTAWQADPLNITVGSLASFGQDHAGELYVLSQEGQVGRVDPV